MTEALPDPRDPLDRALIDLCFERTGQQVTLTDARIDGDIEVVLEIAGGRRISEDA